MNYLLFICSDGVATPEKAAAMRTEVPRWVQEMDACGARRLGSELEHPSSAVTVRVRDGETIVSDGPFAETKEFVAGFDVIDCSNLDDAIAVAARHPVSWFNCTEVRPFAEGPMGSDIPSSPCTSAGEVPTGTALGDPPAAGQRYLLLMCVDGIPATDEVEASIVRDGDNWLAEATQVYGHGLQHADTATTVRVRDGETLISDGPFVEAKEFIGGFAIVDCASREEAIELAAGHPLARYHMIEVRPFVAGG